MKRKILPETCRRRHDFLHPNNESLGKILVSLDVTVHDDDLKNF